jgi:hypothetical protein
VSPSGIVAVVLALALIALAQGWLILKLRRRIKYITTDSRVGL